MSTLSDASIEKLAAEVATLNNHRFIQVQNSVWRMIWFQLLRGLAFGLGSVLGASIIVSLLAWSVSQIEFLPIIGEWAAQIVQEIELAK